MNSCAAAGLREQELVRRETARRHAAPIVDRLSSEINRILSDPQIINEKLAPGGFVPLVTIPEGFMEIMKQDAGKYAKVAKDAHIRSE